MKEGLRVPAAFTMIRSPRARQAVCVALDLATLGAASALLGDDQGPWRAGGAGVQITSHLSIPTLTIPATAIAPSSQVLVGFPLVQTGGFGRGTFRAALPRQADKLRSLGTLNTSTLGPLAEDLTPVAVTEFAARAIPHVSMVTHRPLVQAASLGGGAFITALTSALHFGLTLGTGSGLTGVCVALRLTPVTHTCGAGVLLPLLAMLVLFTSRQTGIGHTLRTAAAWLDHQVLMRFAGHLLTLCYRTPDFPVAADTSGAEAWLPLFTVSVCSALPGARLSIAATLGAAFSSWGERALVRGTAER